jgi:hypothetical protein
VSGAKVFVVCVNHGRCYKETTSCCTVCCRGLSCFSCAEEPLGLQCYEDWSGLVPLASGRIGGLSLLDDARASCSDAAKLLFVKEEVSVSSGIVANFFRTCLSAGRLMGLLEDR